MITKITCRYSFEGLDFNCNDFGFTFDIGVSYLGIFYKISMNGSHLNVKCFIFLAMSNYCIRQRVFREKKTLRRKSLSRG